jgi:hypothetical protein
VQVAARLAVVVLFGSTLAHAAVPSPAAVKRPRMLLDAPLRAVWQAQIAGC